MVINILGFMPAWMGGTDEQKRSADRGDAAAAADCPGDCPSASTAAICSPTRWSPRRWTAAIGSTGEKWLIGNATVADRMAVARAHRRARRPGGPLHLRPGQVAPRRRHRRGAAAREAARTARPRHQRSALRGRVRAGRPRWIGAEGQGLEIALKSSQPARAVISSFAMSAADTALRLMLDFTEGRVIFGRAVSDVPYSRRQLDRVLRRPDARPTR